jgi:hypothetical protein
MKLMRRDWNGPPAEAEAHSTVVVQNLRPSNRLRLIDESLSHAVGDAGAGAASRERHSPPIGRCPPPPTLPYQSG